jgi:HD-GYP domain-containing protein (c-di-GMP phosphodiesterase class II)
MLKLSRVQRFVALACAAAAASMLLAWQFAGPFPGYWQLGCFVLLAFLLDRTSLPLRVDARGSISFVMHMAAAMLFGGFWGGLAAGLAVGLAQSARSAGWQKTVFNVAQRVLSVTLAILTYRMFGGGMPPAYLLASSTAATIGAVQRDLALFFVFALAYFAINSWAVSTVVALSSGRRVRDVWNLNSRALFAYGLGSSALAMIIAWVYTLSEQSWGFGPYGLFFVIGPIILVRHVYGLYFQLQDSGQELLQVMVKAIEARDPYTSGHSVRVSEMSRLIASELDLSAKEVEQIETAALLHDVGKIHEEFAPLLRKESRLTPEETAVMQTHSTKSAELVGIISKFKGFIQDSVRHHHERWDGQGYPAGIAAEAIPLGARIILVCDTIDAMTTDRPYRKRLGLDIVIAELQKCKGTQFDPKLVDVVIGSVSVRRLIAGQQEAGQDSSDSPQRSRKVPWPAPAFWKGARRAH